MTVGVAIAGGSSVALLATVCTLNWLERAGILHKDADLMFGTCSGGTLGTALYNSAGDRLSFPDYDVAITPEKVGASHDEDGKTWFGQVITPKGLWSAKFGDMIRKVFTGQFTWATVLKDVVFNAYDVKEVSPGDHKWITNIMYAPKETCPPIKNKYGYVPDITLNPMSPLGMLWRDFTTGKGEPEEIAAELDTWTTLSYASHIVSYIIMSENSKASFEKKKRFVPSDDKYYFSDGGWIDETAITTMLIEKASSLLAYISWPGLFSADGRISNLFGYTNRGNHTLGPKYSQVFKIDQATLNVVLANLTDPNIMRAKLHNVQVVKNDFFGIEAYTLKTLMILTDQRSPDFMNSFKDKKITQRFMDDPKFPSSYEDWAHYKSDWTPWSANSYCMLQQYKGEKYKDELLQLFADDKKAAMTVEMKAPQYSVE